MIKWVTWHTTKQPRNTS